MTVTVETYPRLHFGFLNVVPTKSRIFGSLGVAVDQPAIRVRVGRENTLQCDHPVAAAYAETSLDLLDLPGAEVSVEAAPPRHSGFGSGTQLALATYTAIANVYAVDGPEPRSVAPALGRANRSGIGVATFEAGGFVIDAGHPAPPSGHTWDPAEWTVPPVMARHAIPSQWRFVGVLPAVESSVHGETEANRIDQVMATANPAITDRISAIVTGELLPGLVTGQIELFGRGIAKLDQWNARWFLPAQEEGYHPGARPAVHAMEASPAIVGVGQSSWGPLVYGVTTADQLEEAKAAAQDGLDATPRGGEVLVLTPQNSGAAIIDGSD